MLNYYKYNMIRPTLLSIIKPRIREVNHRNRILPFTSSEEILDPQRVVNRAMYGTDYDPKDVCTFRRARPI